MKMHLVKMKRIDFTQEPPCTEVLFFRVTMAADISAEKETDLIWSRFHAVNPYKMPSQGHPTEWGHFSSPLSDGIVEYDAAWHKFIPVNRWIGATQ